MDYFGYKVTEEGRIYQKKDKRKLLKLRDHPHGYLMVNLWTPKCEYWLVHRLIATLFIPNPQGLREVNHKDTNKKNNRVDNLEWSTSVDNHIHATKLGIYPSGENHRWSALTEKEVREIRKLKLENPKISMAEISRSYGVGYSAIWHLLKGKTWKNI